MEDEGELARGHAPGRHASVISRPPIHVLAKHQDAHHVDLEKKNRYCELL